MNMALRAEKFIGECEGYLILRYLIGIQIEMLSRQFDLDLEFRGKFHPKDTNVDIVNIW